MLTARTALLAGPTSTLCRSRPTTLLQQMTARWFAVHPQVIDPRSNQMLEGLGRSNYALTKEAGLDYETIIKESGMKRVAIRNKPNTFRSFEEEINRQYSELKATEPTSRLSKRSGVLGYKIGMTHFWDKWGAMVPCTVVQLDRC